MIQLLAKASKLSSSFERRAVTIPTIRKDKYVIKAQSPLPFVGRAPCQRTIRDSPRLSITGTSSGTESVQNLPLRLSGLGALFSQLLPCRDEWTQQSFRML